VTPLFALLVLHAVCGSAILVSGRRLGRSAWIVAGVAPLATLVWSLARRSAITGDGLDESLTWVPQLGLAIDLRADGFSALMILLVSGIGTLVVVYAWHYFGSSVLGPRVAGLLTLFAGAMFGLVIADNLLAIFLFWELTSITSYLLIGTKDTEPEARAAAQHALLVTGLGGLVMLAGLVLLGQQGGTFRLSTLLDDPPSGSVTSVAVVLVLIGAFTKSAQYPFHSWLPGAMVAPTPISAYLHSAAMVKAGIYLVARLAPAFADVGIWRPLVVTVGLVTMVVGGLRALRPFDLKQLLAFGTISQLGFLMVLFGIGHPEATAAGCALILAHGVFKAALFMVVGIVDHETHTRDIRELPLLGAGWGLIKLTTIVSAASMAAVTPLAGFIAKEKAYEAFVEGSGSDRIILGVIVTGSVLTVAYSLRLIAAVVRPDMLAPSTAPRRSADHHPSRGFVAPAVLLAVVTTALGIVPALWSSVVDSAANALDDDARAYLKLWHGVNAALILSVVTLVLGTAVFLARRPIASAQSRLAPRMTGADVYDASVRGVLRFARRLTGIVQPGSLPVYAGVILATAAIAPLVALLTGDHWQGWPEPIGNAAHIPIAALLIIGSLAATIATRRFAAVILLGIVGYSMAVLFVIHGAPDLALTQFGVETLFVVVFLLVMRQLPDSFERRDTRTGLALRLLVAGSVGVLAVLMALSASGSRTAPPVSGEMSELAYSEGYGSNVVNVILVDIRGLDTLGEITVLVAAAIGIAALARAGRRPRPSVTPAPGEHEVTV
jgi:multicomponent Na+:H+ antiporter subunit A